MTPFDYPADPLVRRHGPEGYANYESYRSRLRDEFIFRCVYCLKREDWSHQTGEYQLDHFKPQALNPELGASYDNLFYSCSRCNLAKSNQSIPDPGVYLTAEHVAVYPDGQLEANSKEAEELIWKLDLNSPQACEWRMIWIRNIELAKDHDSNHFVRLMGLPTEPPNLSLLRPPEGNSKPEGISDSYYAKSQRGELPECI